MTIADAFLEAIIANPEDDAVRLIYADWLQERVYYADRAEFIRVQIALADELRLVDHRCRACGWVIHRDFREAESGCPMCVKRAHAKERVASLLRAHYRQWLRADIGAVADKILWTDAIDAYRRGFVEKVSLTLERWLEHGPELVKKVPLRSVDIADRRPALRQINNQQGWEWLESLPASPRGQQYLPSAIFRLLHGGTVTSCSLGPGMPVFEVQLRYSREQEAIAALSQACLLWAKSQ